MSITCNSKTAAPHRPYIPADAEQFRSFMLNLLRYTEKKFLEWRIPSQALEDIESLYADFIKAFNTVSIIPTPSTMLAQQKAQEKVTAALTEFIDRYLQSPPLAESDRAQMGIQ